MRPKEGDAAPASAARAAAGIVWSCFKSAMFVSATTGLIVSSIVTAVMLVLAIGSEDRDVSALMGVLMTLVLGFAFGVTGGIVLAAFPTFLLGFGMTLLSLFKPFARHRLIWAVVGGTCGFFLIELSLVFPPHAIADDLVGLRLLLIPVGTMHALLFRRRTMPQAERLWQIVAAGLGRASRSAKPTNRRSPSSEPTAQ